MSFKTAVENVELTAARNKIDRLLIALPEDETEALHILLANPSLSSDKLSKLIKSEAHEGVLEPHFYQVSDSAVKRWRGSNLTSVNGL